MWLPRGANTNRQVWVRTGDATKFLLQHVAEHA